MIKSIKNLLMIGDKILIKPLATTNKTGSGLYLPPSVKEKDAAHTGIVIKVGPGFPLPSNQDDDSFLHEKSESVNYLPLQVKEGDQAIYLHNNQLELEFNEEKYVVVNQNAILLVFRDDLADLGIE